VQHIIVRVDLAKAPGWNMGGIIAQVRCHPMDGFVFSLT
jgi:hypothetical protein